MKKASDNQQNKNTTSKPASTENPTGPANRTSKKKGKTPSQRRRVQVAYALLTLIAVSLFILLVLLPRPDSKDLTDRVKNDGKEGSPEKATERAAEGEESQQVESGPLTVPPSLDGSATTDKD